MTRDEILAMVPGPEIDEAVGKSIGATPTVKWYAMNEGETAYYMDFERKSEAEDWHNSMVKRIPEGRYVVNGGHIVRQEIYRQYSKDISAAWDVAEKLALDGWEYSLNRYNRLSAPFEFCLLNVGKRIPVWSNKIPEAICKAALLAKEVPE